MKLRPLVAEFVGTFGLVYVSTLAGAILSGRGPEIAALGLAEGFIIAVLATSLAPASGAYFNPAITFGMMVTRRIDLKTAVSYIVVQLLAALVAALIVRESVPAHRPDPAWHGTTYLLSGLTLGQGVLVEAILTFFLVLVTFGTSVDKRTPHAGALFVGLTIALGVFAGGRLTGAAMNPARWFGPALVSGRTENALVWIVGPLIGATIGALLYTFAIEEPESRAEESDKVKEAQV